MRHVTLSKDGKWGAAVCAPGETRPKWSYGLTMASEYEAIRQVVYWSKADHFGGFPEDFQNSKLSVEKYRDKHFSQEASVCKQWYAVIFIPTEPETNELGIVAP